MLESKRKSIIPLIYKGMRILKSSVDRIIASICSQSASSAGWISRSRKPLQKQNRGPRYKKVYSIFFIWITVLLIGCSGENSNPGIGAISMGSIKDSFLNLIHSHSSNQSLIPSSGLYVFVSSYTNNASVPPLSHNGNFGGTAGADAYCNSHIPSSLTGTGSYKAMLVDGTNRVATTVGATSSTGQKDWVFEKNTSYYRADGNLVFTTNDAGLFDFRMEV
ncbi:PF07588 family protein [Leptospira borgpetersenii str. 200701203]|uniref:PF07588 family protein n=1 Tax=Leptospira borgpetersenii str. 200701203 TaxID=1193007 RepID=M3FHL4_LEPBO|nr:PF07588 family protein [Leptospira borgpetersenii str. 200701203]